MIAQHVGNQWMNKAQTGGWGHLLAPRQPTVSFVPSVVGDKPDEPYQTGKKSVPKAKKVKTERKVKVFKGRLPKPNDFKPQADDSTKRWNKRSFREHGGSRIRFKGKQGEKQDAEAVLVGEQGDFHIVYKGKMLPMATSWKPLWDKNAPPGDVKARRGYGEQKVVSWSTKHWGKIEDY
jgi:hypothetical protein